MLFLTWVWSDLKFGAKINKILCGDKKTDPTVVESVGVFLETNLTQIYSLIFFVIASRRHASRYVERSEDILFI